MNDDKQSIIDWLQAIELERDLTLADWNKAKEMHRREHAATARDWWVEGASDAHKTPTGRYESFHDYYAKKFKQ